MIENIQRNSLIPTQYSPKSAAKEVSDTFGKIFDEVNASHLEADKKVDDLVTGRNKDIHGTMIALEKADISQKLFTAVRNKMVSAYEEIMRMQV